MNKPQLSAEMEKRFDKEFGSVYCSTAGAKVDEYLRVYSRCNIQIKHFLATALEEQKDVFRSWITEGESEMYTADGLADFLYKKLNEKDTND